MSVVIEHAERAHALLGASSAHRWLNCTPSAVLEAEKPDTTSAAAEEGTAAHELAEYELRTLLGEDDLTRPVSDLEDEDMVRHAKSYAAYVAGLLEDLAEPFVSIEQRLDYSGWVPGGFGTGDCVIVADGILHVVDFKYGQGVHVEAKNNPQLMLYALGAYEAYNALYEIDWIELTIYQPRRDNTVSTQMPVHELLNWAEHTLRPKAALAAAGEGKFAPGDWCQFCKLAPTCRARADKMLALAAFEFAPAPELDDTELAAVLQAIPGLTSWAADVQKHAETQAQRGRVYPGFKLVRKASRRYWRDEEEVAKKARAKGLRVKDIYTRKLIGIPAMEKLMGKQDFATVLGGLVDKPEGALTLVPVSDKRAEVVLTRPADEFQVIEEN
ncbi:DUF2800 domain-containing protein [Trueperella pyogenes]|uniref:DUF2800 domain-containing protein n=1 Tax=Trueperella pyogenes TaxID=1661 RepID=UPI00339D516E